jgi:hypothetical protein
MRAANGGCRPPAAGVPTGRRAAAKRKTGPTGPVRHTRTRERSGQRAGCSAGAPSFMGTYSSRRQATRATMAHSTATTAIFLESTIYPPSNESRCAMVRTARPEIQACVGVWTHNSGGVVCVCHMRHGRISGPLPAAAGRVVGRPGWLAMRCVFKVLTPHTPWVRGCCGTPSDAGDAVQGRANRLGMAAPGAQARRRPRWAHSFGSQR